MKRRALLKKSALAMGFTLSSSTMSMVLNACSSKREFKGTVFLANDQAKLVEALSGCILPKSDTPGAIETKAFRIIDIMLNDVIDDKRKASFIHELNLFKDNATQALGDQFENVTMSEQVEFLKSWISQNFIDENSEKKYFFRLLKELVLLSYYSSENIGEQVLQYNPIPGAYNGCLEITPDTYAWST